MRIYRDLSSSEGDLALSLGFFDGLHKGHQSVINAAVAEKECGLTPAVLTFSESPQNLLSKDKVLRLMTGDCRRQLLEQMGVQVLYEIDFTSIMNLSADEFVEQILQNGLGAKKVFCGFNYHFGKNGSGNESTLKLLCSQRGIKAQSMPPVIYEGEAVSSTRIRNALQIGDVKLANKMLGRRFSFDFTVTHGNELGRKMETPTINQIIPDDFILPKFGVYATYATFDGVRHRAVTNIGVKPTVGSDKPLAETWILEKDIGSLYGCNPSIELVEFIRPERKFDSIPQLQEAIFKDGQRAKNIFQSIDTSL